MRHMFYNELKKEIAQGKLRRTYILYGEDEGFIKEIVEEIEKKSGLDPEDIFNYIRIDGQKAEMSELQDSLLTLPFMGNRKLVEVFRADFFTGTAAIRDWQDKIKLISEFVQDPPEDTLLILYYITDQDKKDTKIKALEKKAHKDHTIVMKMPVLKKENVAEYLEDYFKAKNIEVSKTLLTYIRENFEGNILQLTQDMDKILAYSQGRNIEKRDIDLLMVKSGTRHKYDLLDMVMQGKAKDAVALYNELIYKRTEPHEILETCGYRLREAYNFKIRIAAGVPTKTLMEELNERMPWLVEKKITMYRNISLPRLSKMFSLLLDAEERMKGTPTDAEREIEMLILSLAGTVGLQ